MNTHSSYGSSVKSLLGAKSLPSLEEGTRIIIEQARQLVNQLINIRGNDKPPFLPEDFARLNGVNQIAEAELGDTSAILLRLSDGYVIKVNKNHYPVRQRFSCAHEVGHLLFNDLGLERYLQKVAYRTSYPERDSKARYLKRIKERESSFNPQRHIEAHASARERLCDIAATELLMPEPIFRIYLSSFGVSVGSVEGLARSFGVSIPAAAFRIAEVSPEPCVTLLWKSWSHKNKKILKLAACVGPGISFPNKARYLPKYWRVNSPSVLHKAYEQDTVFNCFRDFKYGNIVKSLAMESKGFGYSDNRYVISLAFPRDE